MALVDFFRQSNLFNRPHDPNTPSDLLITSTSRLLHDGDPAGDLEDHSVFVDIEDFMKSVLHVPSDWRTQWGPVIRAVKQNPYFVKHYRGYRVRRERKRDEPEEKYRSLLMMNDATIRAAFPSFLGRGATSAPLQLRQFVHIVHDGSSADCILEDGSSIPRLITGGNVS